MCGWHCLVSGKHGLICLLALQSSVAFTDTNKNSGGFLNELSEGRLHVKQLHILFCAMLSSLFSHRFQFFHSYLILLLQAQEAERGKKKSFLRLLPDFQTYLFFIFLILRQNHWKSQELTVHCAHYFRGKKSRNNFK